MLIQKYEWFRVNGLSLNTDKTNVILFKSNHLQDSTFQTSYKGKEIKGVINTEILGLGLENHMNWKTDIDSIILKLTWTYVIRSMSFLSDISTLTMIYSSHFHSIMEYGIIFCGKSPVSRKVSQ